MKADSNDLMFSIVVPVYEHWHLVPQLLTCLRQQTLPQHRFEVIVVDNGSGDISIPHELADNVDILYCTTPGSYAARNEGVKRAKGTWLIFTDADCLPHPEWLASYSHYIDKLGNHFCLLTGPIEMVLNTTEPNVYQIYDSVKGIPQYRYYKRGYAATANLAVNRQVMEAVGGFDSQRFQAETQLFVKQQHVMVHCLTGSLKLLSAIPLEKAGMKSPAKQSESKVAKLLAVNWPSDYIGYLGL